VTGERLRLQGTALMMEAVEKLRTTPLAEADTYRSARTTASLGFLLDRRFKRLADRPGIDAHLNTFPPHMW
jgi:hypothetical protein